MRAARDGGQPWFALGDMFALPVETASFDLVISVRLVPHVEDWPRLLAEMCRVSRRTVLFDYPSLSGLNALTPLLFSLKKSLEGNTRTYLSFTRHQLADELARHGFADVHEVKQFLLPMVVHRQARGAAPLRWLESLFRIAGLTALWGSPIILRADRRAAVPGADAGVRA